ncbi:MAG: ribbon-helix-helix protein, CopG family [Bacillota bacterium]|nr:ribbon-helix-helix protein, CopG family [Bacillota bacterium]MDW7684250.1 ribbon-helix-helix protein, CopG family [Bacillota bacterium]
MAKEKLEARLEIRLTPGQLDKLKSEAEETGSSVGELVREAIDQRYQVSKEEKLAAVREIASLNAPVSDWETMKKEIESRHRKP